MISRRRSSAAKRRWREQERGIHGGERERGKCATVASRIVFRCLCMNVAAHVHVSHSLMQKCVRLLGSKGAIYSRRLTSLLAVCLPGASRRHGRQSCHISLHLPPTVLPSSSSASHTHTHTHTHTPAKRSSSAALRTTEMLHCQTLYFRGLQPFFSQGPLG